MLKDGYLWRLTIHVISLDNYVAGKVVINSSTFGINENRG